MKRFIGRLFLRLCQYADDSAIREVKEQNTGLQHQLDECQKRIIPALQRQIDLEQAEVAMLKEKLLNWRLEMQADIAIRQERIGEIN